MNEDEKPKVRSAEEWADMLAIKGLERNDMRNVVLAVQKDAIDWCTAEANRIVITTPTPPCDAARDVAKRLWQPTTRWNRNFAPPKLEPVSLLGWDDEAVEKNAALITSALTAHGEAVRERCAKAIEPQLPSWDGKDGKAKYEEAVSCVAVIRALNLTEATMLDKCQGCGTNYADPPSKLCPGCQAYGEHIS